MKKGNKGGKPAPKSAPAAAAAGTAAVAPSRGVASLVPGKWTAENIRRAANALEKVKT